MKIRFGTEYLVYTNGLVEVDIPGKTVGECVDILLERFPQLYIHWMDNQAEEGKKSAFYLNGEFIWESESVKLVVDDTCVLDVTKTIPSGSGAIGKIIAGVVLIIIAAIIYTGGWWTGIGAVIGTMCLSMGIGMLISGVGELIVGSPSLPTMGDYGASGSNTPTYSFSGIKNTTTVGTPLGLVYGTHRVGGQLLNVYTDVEGAATYLYAQLGLCEGEIDSISSVEINKNPVNFYSDVAIDYRLGASSQSVLPWFTRTENSVSVGGYITATGFTYETSKIVDAVKLIVSAPQLYYSDSSGLHAAAVTFNIYYKKTTDSSFTYHSAQTISGQTKSETLGEYLLSFPSTDIYNVKVIRVTTDHSGNLSYGDTIYLKTVNEINYDQFSYPCTAMLGLKIKATDQLSGSMPTITSLVKGQKVLVPNNYNPTTHTYSSQTWDGTFAAAKQWTDNPVWCLYDLLTNRRYGLGDYYRLDASKISIIKAQFYLMARYCDELVNGEPRFTLNIVIDSSKSALEWVKTITSIMRANLYYTEGRLWLDINRPKPITHLFNMSNIISGSYTQSGASYKKLPNVYNVQWPNPSRSYEYSMFSIEHMDLQREDIVIEERTAAMNLVGVTSFAHARRLAKYALLAGRTLKKTVSFKAAAAALLCLPTDVIGIQHDVPQWGYGARVVSYDEATHILTLSNDIVASVGSTYDVQIASKGQAPKIYSCTPVAGSLRSVTLNEIPNPLPSKDDIYIIGETDYSVKPFTIISIREIGNGEVEVVAVEYNESLYAAAEDLTDQAQVLVHNYSSLPAPNKVSVADFKASEKIYIANDGTIKTGIECFFSPQNSTLYWEGAIIHYSVDGTAAYQQTVVNNTGYVFIPDLLEQTTYKVVATSAYRDGTKQSINQALADSIAVPYVTVTLLGKTAPPAAVQGFSVLPNIQNNNYLKFVWNPTGEVDLSHYEIRKGSVWETAEIIKDYIKETYYNEYFITTTGTYEFLIKAVDTSNNYSVDAASVTGYAQVEPQNVTGLQAKQSSNSILISWNANPELDILGYTLKEGASWEASMLLLENTPNTNYTINGITNRTYQFWIKAIDIYGNESIYATNASCNAINVPIANIYLTFDESGSGWPGTKDNVTVDSGSLSLPAVNMYDDILTYDSTHIYDFFTLGTGTYITPTYDLGYPMNANLIFDYTLSLGAGDIFKIEIATSDGLENSLWDDGQQYDTGIRWDDPYRFTTWSMFTGGYITARYFKLRLTLLNVSGLLSVNTFATYVDVPDVTQRGSNVSVPIGGQTITFSYGYFEPPTINLTTIGTGYPKLISKTNNNFVVQVYNGNDIDIGGVIDWIATGY